MPFGSAPIQWPERPMRCSATAIARGEPSCTTRSTDPMSIPSSSDAVATTARSSPLRSRRSDVEAHLAGQAAVMRHHEALAEALVERERHALAHAPRSDEDQRRAVLANLLRDAIVDLAPHLAARDRSELVGRHLDRELHRAAVADVDDPRRGAQEARDLVERPHRCGEADALRLACRRHA